MARSSIDWDAGTWTNLPVLALADSDGLLVEAREGSDAWVETSYGFTHDTEHALLTPFSDASAMEVTFRCDYYQQFDQAGIFIRVDKTHWIKAGVEFSDGQLQLGAVVTNERSDWSLAPVPDWAGQLVTVRASRTRGAITIRAGVAGHRSQLVRLAPFSSAHQMSAGPFCCSPTHSKLTIRFKNWSHDDADQSLH